MKDALMRILAGDAPVFILIAGPNGAGKSTFSEKRLKPISFPYIDPDEIARQTFGGGTKLSKEDLLAATKKATDNVRQCFSEGRSVCLETVFSDTKGHKLGLLAEARSYGFRTAIIFIGVDSPQVSIARVADRVENDHGHDVPDDLILKRFPRCFENLKKAIPIVDLAILIDNTGCYGPMDDRSEPTRHYQFAVVERGALYKIEAQVPWWYCGLGINQAVSQL